MSMPLLRQKNKFVNFRSSIKNSAGFTLMEIVVATTIFAFVAVAMMSLFNYTLKINRKTEAIRQASQGMRTFVEALVKQIRNGQVYYGTTNGGIDTIYPSGTTACQQATRDSGTGKLNAYYQDKENSLRILDVDGSDICFYLADQNKSYVGRPPGATKFSAVNGLLVMEKNVSGSSGIGTYSKQILNPTNFYVDNLMFIIRPVCDPYDNTCGQPYNTYPKTQPMVSIFMKVRAQLPSGEQVPIYYQTTVSSSKYDIPNQ